MNTSFSPKALACFFLILTALQSCLHQWPHYFQIAFLQTSDHTTVSFWTSKDLQLAFCYFLVANIHITKCRFPSKYCWGASSLVGQTAFSILINRTLCHVVIFMYFLRNHSRLRAQHALIDDPIIFRCNQSLNFCVNSLSWKEETISMCNWSSRTREFQITCIVE